MFYRGHLLTLFSPSFTSFTHVCVLMELQLCWMQKCYSNEYQNIGILFIICQ